MSKICVIGGGVTGLTIARKKKELGHSVKLLESSCRVGGVIMSEKTEGYLLDYGANTLNVRLKSTQSILEDSGAWNCCIEANPDANKRMIVRNGKIIDLPTNFTSFIKSPFLSPKGKLRLIAELFIKRSKKPEQETVASFFSRRFGNEVLQYAANPFLAGIYAAKPESLNLSQAFPRMSELERNHRSIILGAIKSKRQRFNPNIKKPRLISYENGMEELIHKLSSKISDNIYLNQKVRKITKKANTWEIGFQEDNSEICFEEFKEVIVTIPSHKLNSIEWNNLKEQKEIVTLGNAIHFPMALSYLGYNKDQISHPLDGFGFLVPEVENLKILGTLFSSTLFAGRAPEGKVLLTTFIGGERNPEFAGLTNSKITTLAHEELQSLLGIKGKPAFEKVKKWQHAIPLPDQSMSIRKQSALKLAKANEGLSFLGSHLSGVSLPVCLEVI